MSEEVKTVPEIPVWIVTKSTKNASINRRTALTAQETPVNKPKIIFDLGFSESIEKNRFDCLT